MQLYVSDTSGRALAIRIDETRPGSPADTGSAEELVIQALGRRTFDMNSDGSYLAP